MKEPNLKDLESFRCEPVILKFSRDFKICLKESESLFKETMKMLWLMIHHRLELQSGVTENIPPTIVVQKAMDPLDQMWHEFILHTNEYHQFCNKFFGEYIHHVPCSEEEYRAFQSRKTERGGGFEESEKQKIQIFVEYIIKNLGVETLEMWFKGLPKLRKI